MCVPPSTGPAPRPRPGAAGFAERAPLTPAPLPARTTQVDWLDLPDGTLVYLFEQVYLAEGGRQSIENISKVCRHWREAALEVVMRDTAGSKMKQYVRRARARAPARTRGRTRR